MSAEPTLEQLDDRLARLEANILKLRDHLEGLRDGEVDVDDVLEVLATF